MIIRTSNIIITIMIMIIARIIMSIVGGGKRWARAPQPRPDCQNEGRDAHGGDDPVDPVGPVVARVFILLLKLTPRVTIILTMIITIIIMTIIVTIIVTITPAITETIIRIESLPANFAHTMGDGRLDAAGSRATLILRATSGTPPQRWANSLQHPHSRIR